MIILKKYFSSFGHHTVLERPQEREPIRAEIVHQEG